MGGLENMPKGMNEQADQVLGADAELLEGAAALRRPAAHARVWRLAVAALAGGTARWLRRVQQAGPAEGEGEPPDLPDLLG